MRAGAPFVAEDGNAANQAMVEVHLLHASSGRAIALLGAHLKAGACPHNGAVRAQQGAQLRVRAAELQMCETQPAEEILSARRAEEPADQGHQRETTSAQDSDTNAGSRSNNSVPAVIVCGDFNDTPTSACLDVLLDRRACRYEVRQQNGSGSSDGSMQLRSCWEDYHELVTAQVQFAAVHRTNGHACNGHAVLRTNGTAVAGQSGATIQVRRAATRELAASGVSSQSAGHDATAAAGSAVPGEASTPAARAGNSAHGSTDTGSPAAGQPQGSSAGAGSGQQAPQSASSLFALEPFTTWKFRRHQDGRPGIEEKKAVIDHVLYDEARLEVLGIVGMPREVDVGAAALPSAVHPSDHLPVLVRLKLR
jgi:endonuclease/exonuclease/phosphatase family metal-dependent hydrolase